MGEFLSDLIPFLCRAKFAALPKPDGGGLRPIAVGETLRRIVSKAAAAKIGPELRETLEPVQLVVGTKSGAEMIAHTVQNWCAKTSGDPGNDKEMYF